MKWYEFLQDNGDGSYSKRRFRTKEEAEEALEYLENTPWWAGGYDGVNVVDTESEWFFDSLEDLKRNY